jgi:hypothetical protein
MSMANHYNLRDLPGETLIDAATATAPVTSSSADAVHG